MIWVAIGVGGGIGAMARHALNHALHRHLGDSFPVGIFVVNLTGCFAIGALAGLLAAARIQLNETSRAFLVVGLLGGFTTVSSYSLDSYTLIRGGHTGLALLNLCGQAVLGLLTLWVGFLAGSWRP